MNRFFASLTVACAALCALPAFAAPGDLLFKITAPDPQPGAAFGRVIAAVDGDILVGEPARLRPGLDAPGRAHLFDGQTGKLKWSFDNPEPTDLDLFGHALTGGDGRAFISTSGLSDRVYAFSTKSGHLLHTIYEPDRPSGSNFGSNVVYGGGSVLVSNPSFSLNSQFPSVGRAYLFDAASGALQLPLPNPEPETGDGFGNGDSAVATFGTKAVVGAYLTDLLGDEAQADADNVGRVWVFDRSSGEVVFTLDNPNPEAGPPSFFSDRFGATVAANEQVIAIGAINDDTSGVADSGTVYVFDSKTGSLRHTLYSSELISRSNFGQSLAVTDEGNVVVGAWWTSVDGIEAAGHAYLFDGLTGSLLLDIPNPDPISFAAFGSSVAAIGNRIVVSADGASLDGLPRTGAVYVFEAIPEPSSVTLTASLLVICAAILKMRRLRRTAVQVRNHRLNR